MTDPPPTSLTFIINDKHAGVRLDRALSELLPDVSRAQIQRDIKKGYVSVNGEPPPRGAKTTVRVDDRVDVIQVPPEPMTLVAEAIPLSILHEDEDLIAVNKPAPMVVHPALGHSRGTLVNALLHHLQRRPEDAPNVRPGIVHRLDQGTTGVIVVAKHPQAHDRLAAAFKAREVDKIYDAVVVGVPKPPRATIETKYGRHPKDRKKFSSRVHEGKSAITNYQTLEVFTGLAHIEVQLETGRTHQIRVHMADRGHSLIGDDVYGRRRRFTNPNIQAACDALTRPALHARRLALMHPRTNKPLSFEAPLPQDLVTLLTNLRKACATIRP